MRHDTLNLGRLNEYDVVCIDTETTGLNWRKDRIFGVAISALDTREQTISTAYYDIRDTPRVVEVLRRSAPSIKRFVNHNAKFDAHFLRETSDIILPFGRVECTCVRAALIDEHLPSYSLDSVAKKYTGIGKDEFIYVDLANMFGGKPTKEAQIKNLQRAPAELAGRYATQDTEAALMLWLAQEVEIEKQDLHRVWGMERELTSVLIGIEKGGVRVDEEFARLQLSKIGPANEAVINDLLTKYGGVGIDKKVFNSPKQKRQMFGVEKRDGKWWVGDVMLVESDAGNPTLDADALRILAETHKDERAILVMRAQKLDKARQFLENHVLGHMENGRVYPNYNQTKSERGSGTGTGRFSIEDPALQQIPKRDKEMAAIVRPCFVPDSGDQWACADWEQFEFRWFAHYVNDGDLNKTYSDNPDADFHKTTADLTGLPRNPRFAGDANAKQINLGLVFGMGMGKLAAEMGLPYTIEEMNIGGEKKEVFKAGPQAEMVFKQYHDSIPGVRKLLQQAASIAKSRGYVQTIHGRHIRFPGGKFTHKAGGLVFQGTSADSCKMKMIELYHNGHKQGKFRLLLSVHDEFDVSVRPGDTDTINDIKRRLENFDGVECPIHCRIPIKSDINVGPNWYEASK